jgi:hypothetical protein
VCSVEWLIFSGCSKQEIGIDHSCSKASQYKHMTASCGADSATK